MDAVGNLYIFHDPNGGDGTVVGKKNIFNITTEK
jgi:hypothetical protein